MLTSLLAGGLLVVGMVASPSAQATERPLETFTDGPITIDVLRVPTDDRIGKVRMTWDLNGVHACLENGGVLQYQAWIGNVDLEQTVLHSDEYNVASASLEVELPAGRYAAMLDPFQCEFDSGTASGNTWVVQFTLTKCDADANSQIASPTFIQGSATVTMPDGSQVPLTKDSQVPVGARITTRPGTRIEMRSCFFGTSFRIGPSSSVRVTKAYFVPGEKKFSWKLFFGQVWTVLSGGSDKPTMEVETETHGVGVRGTIFCLSAGKKQGKPWTLLQVTEGVVEFTSKATGKSIRVRAGQYAEAIGMNARLRARPMPAGTVPTAETCAG